MRYQPAMISILANYEGIEVLKALVKYTEYSAFVTITCRVDGQLMEDVWEFFGNPEEDKLLFTKELEHDAYIN